MLSKKFRLNRNEIEELKTKRHNILQGRFFALIFKETNLPGKFGLIISNKISPSSIRRNKIKRLLCQAIKNELSGSTGLFLFLAKKNSLNGALELFEEEMDDFRNETT